MNTSRGITTEGAAIGLGVRTARKRLGWTRDQLSEESGVSVSMIAKVEQGRSRPSARTAMRLARALRVEVDDLLTPADADGVHASLSGPTRHSEADVLPRRLTTWLAGDLCDRSHVK